MLPSRIWLLLIRKLIAATKLKLFDLFITIRPVVVSLSAKQTVYYNNGRVDDCPGHFFLTTPHCAMNP